MQFGFMDVILLYSYHRHVSANHLAIFRVVSAWIQIYLWCVVITRRVIARNIVHVNVTVFVIFYTTWLYTITEQNICLTP